MANLQLLPIGASLYMGFMQYPWQYILLLALASVGLNFVIYPKQGVMGVKNGGIIVSMIFKSLVLAVLFGAGWLVGSII